MDGQDLSVLIEGGAPEARPHFSLGYHDHVFTRDEDYAMMGRNDGRESRLYDMREDPGMHDNIAGERAEHRQADVRRLRTRRRRRAPAPLLIRRQSDEGVDP